MCMKEMLEIAGVACAADGLQELWLSGAFANNTDRLAVPMVRVVMYGAEG